MGNADNVWTDDGQWDDTGNWQDQKAPTAAQIRAWRAMYDALEVAEALFHHTFAMDGTIHKQVKAALALARGEKVS